MKNSNRGVGLLALAFVALAPAAQVTAQDDWPGWRGPNRDGSLGDHWACANWPGELEQRWQVAAGSGYSSPIVSGERVFLVSREGQDEIVQSLDFATGREIWRQAYPAPFKPGTGGGKHGAGPKSTPALADGRLFTLGITGVLSAWDAVDGELLWRLDAGTRFPKASPRWGTATSPLVDGERVIVHLGGKGEGALLALDAATGRELWSSSGSSSSYASPVVVQFEGVRQVVTQTDEAFVSVALDSGQLLWRLPFSSSMTAQNVVTPLPLGDGTLVLSGKKRGIWAAKPTRQGDVWNLETLWRDEDLASYMSSPVASNGRLFGLSPTKKGQLFALEAATGRRLWVTEGRETENAALLSASGAVLALSAEGELWVLDPDAETPTRLATYRVSDQPTWAHPAVVRNQILIKDSDSLTLWALDCGS